jgi:membrane protein DedA with SNARE-associated domain
MIQWYLSTLEQTGLAGVVLLMAMESSIFPVPSELVVPPAVYVLAHGRSAASLRMVEVILAGTLGSYLGSSITYWVARWGGRPVVRRYSRFLHLSHARLQHAEDWMRQYGALSVFVSRLLPGIRHINAIPAGLMRMPFGVFSLMTVAGAAVWCSVLAILGRAMGGEMAAVLAGRGESQAYREAVTRLVWASVLMAAAMVGLYMLGRWLQRRKATPA